MHPDDAPAGGPDSQGDPLSDKGLERARYIATLMDSSITLPGGFKIGLDSVIGVIPVIGDLVTGAAGMMIITEGMKRGLPPEKVGQMVFNTLLDTGLGVFTGVGDVFDFFWKSNQRNLTILEDHLGVPRTFSRDRLKEQRRASPRGGKASQKFAAAAAGGFDDKLIDGTAEPAGPAPAAQHMAGTGPNSSETDGGPDTRGSGQKQRLELIDDHAALLRTECLALEVRPFSETDVTTSGGGSTVVPVYQGYAQVTQRPVQVHTTTRHLVEILLKDADGHEGRVLLPREQAPVREGQRFALVYVMTNPTLAQEGWDIDLAGFANLQTGDAVPLLAEADLDKHAVTMERILRALDKGKLARTGPDLFRYVQWTLIAAGALGGMSIIALLNEGIDEGETIVALLACIAAFVLGLRAIKPLRTHYANIDAARDIVREMTYKLLGLGSPASSRKQFDAKRVADFLNPLGPPKSYGP